MNPVTNLGDVVARAPFLQISLMLEQPQSPLAALIEHGQTPAEALLAKLDQSKPLAPQIIAHAKL